MIILSYFVIFICFLSKLIFGQNLSHPQCGQHFTAKGDKDFDYRNYTAKVFYNGENNECDANVIHEFWLLSAASCLWDVKNPANYFVQFFDGSKGLVEKIVKTPLYNPTLGAGYDIALIKLKVEMNFNYQYQHPICLPNNYTEIKNRDDSQCNVITSANGVEITKATVGPCGDAYQSIGVNNKTQICAQNLARDGRCHGLTGSALQCNGNDENTRDRHVLIGIMSWPLVGDNCRDSGFITMLTKVSNYVNWINTTIHPPMN